MPFALFYRDQRLSEAKPTELDAWRHALQAGLISDLPVADEEGGQVLPRDFQVRRLDEAFEPDPAWTLPQEIS
jgi:hypothetical protein